MEFRSMDLNRRAAGDILLDAHHPNTGGAGRCSAIRYPTSGSHAGYGGAHRGGCPVRYGNTRIRP